MSDYIDFIETFQSGKHKDIRDYMKYSIQEEHVELEVVYGDLSDCSYTLWGYNCYREYVKRIWLRSKLRCGIVNVY